MIAIPAVDIRDGACVQLVGGSYADERIRIADPLAAARRWTDAGFTRLHVVDLDAATGQGNNARDVQRVVTWSGAEMQVGGGMRSTDRVAALFESGVARVVVGTKAVEDPAWLCRLAASYPARIIVAADVRERSIVTHGWMRSRELDVASFVRDIATLPLAGILVTTVQREGRMEGTDLALIGEVVGLTSIPIIASGGIASVAELRALAAAGVQAAVLGMALYTGALDARAVAEEFQS